MKCPAEVYSASCRPYCGIPEPRYPFHDRTVAVTNCGRLCLYNKKINLSVSLAGQAVGVKEVDHGICLVSFMDYDLGYIDLEEKNLAAPAEPLRAKSVTYVSGTDRERMVGSRGRFSNFSAGNRGCGVDFSAVYGLNLGSRIFLSVRTPVHVDLPWRGE